MLTTNVFIAALTLGTLLLAIGCDPIHTPAIAPIHEAGAANAEIGKTVIAVSPAAWGTDAFVITAATVDADTLRINVAYTGGCETHGFTLVAEPRFLESFPVQLRVSLAHTANGDPCQEAITASYRFDLTPLKDVYQNSYRTEQGRIVLRLKDAPPSDLTYDF